MQPEPEQHGVGRAAAGASASGRQGLAPLTIGIEGQLQRVASLVARRAAVGRREQEAVAGFAVAGGDPHLARNQALLAEDPQQAAEEADAVRPADLEVDEAAALGRVVDVEGVEQQGRRVGWWQSLGECYVVERRGWRLQASASPGTPRPRARGFLAGEAVQDRDAEVRQASREAVRPERQALSSHPVKAPRVGRDAVADRRGLGSRKRHQGVVKSAHARESMQLACRRRLD